MIRPATFFTVCFICLTLCANAVGDSLRSWHEKYDRFEAQYEKHLNRLEEWRVEQGLEGLENEVEELRFRKDTDEKLFIAIIPQKVQNPELAQETASKAEKKASDKKAASISREADAPDAEFQNRVVKLRRQASNHLFKLASEAVEDGKGAFAFDLLTKVLEINPDHSASRKILGYERVDDLWLSPFEKQRLKNQVYHPKFGWLPPKFVSRYEQGERFHNGKWISSREDAALHFNIQDGWIVETPHFTIQTNHSLPAAVRIGEEVETLYRVWKQLFVRFFATDAQLKALFSGKRTTFSQPLGSGTNGKHRVVFFRNQDNYVQELSPRYPSVANSCGLYIVEDKASYFFAGENFDRATMLHEVTHQLFSEVRRTSPEVTQKPNFWIIEGIAIHMESLHDEGAFHVVGGFDTPRLLAARIRFTKDNFYVPLAELSALTMTEFQAHPKMVRLYSQCAGLMQFLLHSGDAQYREAVADILRDVYAGQSDANTIPKRLKRSFAELDSEYADFISAKQEELNQWEMD